MELFLTKVNGGLVPAYQSDREQLDTLKSGVLLECKVTKKRNSQFHRKYLALLNIGFECFEPVETEYKGNPVTKNFNRFRKDIIIATGRYDVVARLDGTVKAEAHSMSFNKMDDVEFERLYSDTINVLLQRVMKNHTADSIDHWVNQILNFD